MRLQLMMLALSAAMVQPALTWAQEPPAPAPTALATPAINTGDFSFGVGADFVSKYIFRGFIQEDQGFIAQPYVQMNLNLYQADDFAVSAYLGAWSSFQSKKTGAASTAHSSWYETDIYGGLGIECHDFSAGIVYTFYNYPNSTYNTVQEIGFTVGYNDAKCWENTFLEGFALNPSAGVYFETDNTNSAFSNDPAGYAQLGIAPSYTIDKLKDLPISLSLPVVLGLSYDGYYIDSSGHNDNVGYVSVALGASIPLPLPAKYGSWEMHGNIGYIFYISDSLQAFNGNDGELFGGIGIGMTY
jgi:hypothetical protein